MPTRLRSSVVCLRENEILLVRHRDPVTGTEYLFPPGGHVEAGETPAETARREALEETGYAVIVNEATEEVHRYPFTWAGVTYDCTTHFFKGTLGSSTPVPVHGQAPYVLEALWLPLDSLPKAMANNETLRDIIARMLSW